MDCSLLGSDATYDFSARDALSENYLRNMMKKGSKFKDPMLERRGVESEDVDVSLFESKTGNMTAKRLAEHQEKQARAANRKLAKAEQLSPFSFSNPRFNKALVMSTGSSTYLMLAFHPLAEGHCRIVPITPVASLNDASDEVFEEISKYKRSLEAMAMENGQSLVYMETVMNAKQPGWHTCLECKCRPRYQRLINTTRCSRYSGRRGGGREYPDVL